MWILFIAYLEQAGYCLLKFRNTTCPFVWPCCRWNEFQSRSQAGLLKPHEQAAFFMAKMGTSIYVR